MGALKDMTEDESKKKRVQKNWRFSEDLATKFDETCTARGIDGQAGAEEAIRNWCDGRGKASKIDKSTETMRRIQNKYDGKKCGNCNKPIPASASCWWAPNSPLICEECHSNAELNSQNDPLLLKKDLILQSYNQRIVEAKKLYYFLLNRINQASTREAAPDLERLERDAQMAKGEGWRLLSLYLKDKIGSPEEKQFLQHLAEQLNKLDHLTQSIQQQRRQMNLNPKLTKNLKELLREAEALPEPIPVTVGQKPSQQEQDYSGAQDPNNTARKQAGQIWCQTDTLWVYPTKCQLCKERTPTKYNDCHKEVKP